MPRSLKVAVVGTGVFGLVAAGELQREGHNVVFFKKTNHVGGTWAYDANTDSDPTRETVHGNLYLVLRTNLPRQFMGFSD
ncbi:Flavin-containing monooxygenase FMO GS-OX1 [Spatholobus suberectus]|nr:Flavin-containing monooxygenase FMO GS-OX1 [Spatholobus suberectus]